MKSFIALAAMLMLAGCVNVVSTQISKVPPPSAAPDVSGNWALTVQSPIGVNDVTAMFQQRGSMLSGTIANEQGETTLTGTVEDSNVIFSITIEVQGQSLKLDYSGQVSGDAMSGTVKFGDFGEGTWAGKKKS